MITSEKKTFGIKSLDALDRSEFDFRLTGSMFFNNERRKMFEEKFPLSNFLYDNPDVDIDLFVKDSAEVRHFLLRLGFAPLPSDAFSLYIGNKILQGATDIYSLPRTEADYAPEFTPQIDVQLLSKFDEKIRIQNTLRYYQMDTLPKKVRKIMWSWFFQNPEEI